MLHTGQSITLEYDEVAHKSTLRGWKWGKYFLVDLPVEAKQQMSAGVSVKLIVFGRGSSIEIITRCSSVLKEVKLSVLHFPEEMSASYNRKNDRFNITIPMTITVERDGKTIEEKGVVTNLGKGGCRIATTRKLMNGEKVVLNVKFPTDKGTNELPGVIRTSNSETGSNWYSLEFDALDDKSMGLINTFLSQIEEYYQTERLL